MLSWKSNNKHRLQAWQTEGCGDQNKGREEENPLENFRAMNCFTTLSSNRTVPSAKLSSAVLVSTRYLPPTQFVILGDLCFSKQEEIFRDREEKKIKHTPHHLISVIVLRCLYEEMCSEEVRVLTRQVRMPNWPLKTLLNNNNKKNASVFVSASPLLHPLHISGINLTSIFRQAEQKPSRTYTVSTAN